MPTYLFQNTAWVANLFLRIAVGSSMILVGIAEYRDFGTFYISALDGMGFLWIVGSVWAYILPACMIFGGGLLIGGRYSILTAWIGGMALASIPIGLILKTIMTGLGLEDILQYVYQSFIWLLLFSFAVQVPEVVEPVEEESNG